MPGKPVHEMTLEELNAAAIAATDEISAAGFTIRRAVNLLQDIDRERFIRRLVKTPRRKAAAP